MDGTLAIIGTGKIGEALLRGLLHAQTMAPAQIICTAHRESRCDELQREHGVKATTDNRAAIDSADVILLALKPQRLLHVIADHGAAFHPGQTVISVAAGITTEAIQQTIPAEVAVVRVMTNTPAQVDEAMSVRREVYEAGQDIVTQGDIGRRLYVLQTGEAEVLRLDADGDADVLARLGPGNHFGEISIFEGSRRTATIRATTRTEVLSLGRDAARHLSDASQPIGTHLRHGPGDRDTTAEDGTP